MQELLKQTESLTNRFLALMDEDAASIEPLAQAYRLPKETDADKAEKSRVMEIALKSAVQPPLEIMETCARALPLSRFARKKAASLLSATRALPPRSAAPRWKAQA
jgi:formiminotetrahydrofolate cyclodeaminase